MTWACGHAWRRWWFWQRARRRQRPWVAAGFFLRGLNGFSNGLGGFQFFSGRGLRCGHCLGFRGRGRCRFGRRFGCGLGGRFLGFDRSFLLCLRSGLGWGLDWLRGLLSGHGTTSNSKTDTTKGTSATEPGAGDMATPGCGLSWREIPGGKMSGRTFGVQSLR